MQKPTNDFEKYKTWDKRHFLHPWDEVENFGDDKPDRDFTERAKGIYVYDEYGNRQIDGPAGMWCMQLGYGREDIADAMADQARRMAYCSPFSEGTSVSAELAHEIAKRAPGDLNTVFFTTGGSTAVDTAIRFAHFRNNLRGLPDKKKVISRVNAYHGGTYLTASLSGKPKERAWLDTDSTLCHFIPDVNPFNRPEDMSLETFCDAKVADLENAILSLGPDTVAMFVAEPILASGGVIVPPPGYHKRCLEVCRKYDVLYLSDEVVTGFGRLGHWFASEPVFDIVPDIITCAKGLTAGFAPMGAAIFSDRLLKELQGEEAYFTTGFTYSGHPVCAAAGLKTIEIFEDEEVLEHVRDVAPYFQERLQALRALPIVVDTRGAGLVGCVECRVAAPDGGDGVPELAPILKQTCQDLGLILRPYNNLLIFSPPLTITRAQIATMFDLLEQGIRIGTQELEGQGYRPD